MSRTPTRKNTVISHVRQARRAAGVRQEDLADLTGMSRRALQFVESGTYSPNLAYALRLATVLGTTVEDLFELEEDTGALQRIDAQLADLDETRAQLLQRRERITRRQQTETPEPTRCEQCNERPATGTGQAEGLCDDCVAYNVSRCS